MKEQLIYLIGTLIVVDITVIVAGVVPVLSGGRVGYRWRKLLWLVLAVRLLIPVRFVMNRVYEEKSSYFVQIEMPLSYAVVPVQEDADGRETAVSGNEHSAEREAFEQRSIQQGVGEQGSIQQESNEKEVIEQEFIKKESIERESNQESSINEIKAETKTAEEMQAGEKADTGRTNLEGIIQGTGVGQAGEYANTKPRNAFLEFLYQERWLLLAVWLLVAFALTDYHVIGFVRIRELINMQSRRCEDPYLCSLVQELCEEYKVSSVPQIFFCEEISSPMLLGYRHTQLLLPDRSYTETDLNMIVRHELQHKKNGDLWYKLLIMFVGDIYWFNPVMVIMRKLAYQDVECVCDAQVLCRLPAEERKAYGNIVLSHMVKSSEWDIVYGTSIFTGKRAAKLRIRNMFAAKNKWGYAVLGALVLCVTWGSSMWVLSGQEENAGNASESERTGKPQENALNREHSEDGNLVTFRVEDMDTVSLKDRFELSDYYITNKVTVSNRYYIDENNVLWGYGRNEYGQLGIKGFSMDDFYSEPIKIAEDVVTVDCSVNGYFCVYLTKDGKLYGIGSNLSGLLGVMLGDGIWYNAVVTEPALLLENVAYVRAGMESIAALDRDGNVWWWGEYCGNYHTRVLDHRDYTNAVEDDSNPAKMLYVRPRKILEDCIYVTTGDATGAAISADGGLYTWGRNIFGECGTPVTNDDFVRTPKRVLENVRMVWVEKIAFDSLEEEIPEIGKYKTSYDFNLFAQLADGTMLGVGRGLGDQEKTIAVTGDLVQSSFNIYSDTFVPIAVEEYSEPAVRQLLSGIRWGESVVEVKEFLNRNGFQYFEGETDDGGYSIGVEHDSYICRFEEGRLDHILLQEGGSRNRKFEMGMSMEEVSAYFDSGFTYEKDDWNGIYWANEALDGTAYGFVFSKDALCAIYEKAP